jgi:hypothetical protein
VGDHILIHTGQHHCDEIGPRLVPDAEGQLKDATHRECGDEEGISPEAWVVTVDAVLHRASIPYRPTPEDTVSILSRRQGCGNKY